MPIKLLKLPLFHKTCFLCSGEVIDPITLISVFSSLPLRRLPFQQEEIIWAEIIVRLVMSTLCCVCVYSLWLDYCRGRTEEERRERWGVCGVKHRYVVSLKETEGNILTGRKESGNMWCSLTKYQFSIESTIHTEHMLHIFQRFLFHCNKNQCRVLSQCQEPNIKPLVSSEGQAVEIWEEL